MTEVAKIEQGTVYEQVTPLDDSPGIKNMSILLKQPSGLYVVYRYTTDVPKRRWIHDNDLIQQVHQYKKVQLGNDT